MNISILRLAAYTLFVLVAAVVFAWISITPIAKPVAVAVAPACLARAIVPASWIPWLRPKSARR